MFYYLNGKIDSIETQLAVIDCGGIGFACNTTATTISSLRIGENARLFTYFSVREDAMELYGFSTKNELGMFKKLLGVSGVGPKAALAILSVSTPDRLALAIASGDEKAITAAQGVGKKIAQRVILELKDKLDDVGSGGIPVVQIPEEGAAKTAFTSAQQALVALGYTASDAAAALKGIDLEHLQVGEIVRQALKKMA